MKKHWSECFRRHWLDSKTSNWNELKVATVCEQCCFYLFVLIFASLFHLHCGVPTFDWPPAPFPCDVPTVVTTEKLLVQFNISDVVGTLTCNLTLTVPPSTGFECRVDTSLCACYIKSGQTWVNGMQYNLTVDAYDSNDPGNSTTFNSVIVNIRNASPTFVNLPYKQSNVDAGTVVPNIDVIYTVKATDDDGDTTFFFLYSNTDVFSINKVSGEVRAVEDLHVLTSREESLDIGVADEDDVDDVNMVHSILTLSVINGNHVPFISNWPLACSLSILESVPGNTILLNIDVVDTDNDALFYDFTVEPSTDTGLFSLDKTCACLKTSGLYVFNYERLRQYVIAVQIRDKWSTSEAYTCSVSVTDDNDLPTFTKSIYPVSISEEVTVTVDPSFTCSDEDGEPFTYSFMPVNHSNWFNIDPQSGIITVTSPVDRETLKSNHIYLTVFASDVRGAKGSTQVLIEVEDINDNAPQFTRTTYQLRTTQLTGPGSIIGSIAATDIDEGINSKFAYSCGTHSDYICLSDGSIATSTDLSSIAYGTTVQLICYAIDLGTPTRTGTTYVDITKTKAPTTTTPTTTSTTEHSSWDETEFIVLFSVLMAVIGLLLLCGCYFGLRMCITGYCCGGPAEDCLGYQQSEQQQAYHSNRVGIYDYDDRVLENTNSNQSYQESTRQFPMAKSRY